MVGEIVHIELRSGDFARSAAFYAKLFGWKTDGVQSGGHLVFELPGGVQGSWIRDALALAPGPVPFVAVADVDKSLAEAEKQGGRILVRRMQLAHRGVFGLLADCDGNVIGVLSAKAVGAAGASAAASVPKKGAAGPAPVAARHADPNPKAERKTLEPKSDTKTGDTKTGDTKTGEKKTSERAAKKPASGRKR